MKFIKSIPLALSGLALSIAALGNLLLSYGFPYECPYRFPYGQELRYACGILSGILLTIFALKIVLDFSHTLEELKSPVALSVLPTSTMALMLLCTYLLPFIGFIAICIWSAAVITHLCLMWLFFKCFVFKFSLKNVFPGWFVSFVGIVTVSVTAPVIGADEIGKIAFIIGFTLYFVALALIIVRLIKVKEFPEPARPTFAIFTAPMSLCIVGYFSSFENQNEIFVYSMLAIAIASYIFVTIKMISLLRLKFYPTYAAFTFPFVISATAFRFGASFLAERGIYFFDYVAYYSLCIAVLIVLYVLVRYIMYFHQKLKV